MVCLNFPIADLYKEKNTNISSLKVCYFYEGNLQIKARGFQSFFLPLQSLLNIFLPAMYKNINI